MFTPHQLRERIDEKPFRIKMSSGDAYDIKNHGGAWVLRNAIVIGLDPDAEGFTSHTRRCAILHIANIEDIPASQKAA